MKKSVLDKKIQLPYSSPKGYFDTLSDRFINKVQNVAEEIVVDKPGITIPLHTKNYFNSLSNQLLERIQQQKEESEPIQFKPNALKENIIMPYKVHANYFDTLSEKVLLKTKFEENRIKELNQNIVTKIQLPYKTPSNYFNDLTIQLLQKIEKPKINFKETPMYFFNSYKKYVAIAAVLLITVSTGWKLLTPNSYHQYQKISPMNEQQILAELNSINEQELNEHLNQYENVGSEIQENDLNAINTMNQDNFYQNTLQVLLNEVK